MTTEEIKEKMAELTGDKDATSIPTKTIEDLWAQAKKPAPKANSLRDKLKSKKSSSSAATSGTASTASDDLNLTGRVKGGDDNGGDSPYLVSSYPYTLDLCTRLCGGEGGSEVLPDGTPVKISKGNHKNKTGKIVGGSPQQYKVDVGFQTVVRVAKTSVEKVDAQSTLGGTVEELEPQPEPVTDVSPKWKGEHVRFDSGQPWDYATEAELFKALSAEHRRRIAILQDVEGVLMTARHWLSPLTSALVDIRASLA